MVLDLSLRVFCSRKICLSLLVHSRSQIFCLMQMLDLSAAADPPAVSMARSLRESWSVNSHLDGILPPVKFLDLSNDNFAVEDFDVLFSAETLQLVQQLCVVACNRFKSVVHGHSVVCVL